MRTLLALTLAFLPLIQAQDSPLKSVQPDYGKYSPDLTTDFDAASASVTLTVQADGTPVTLDQSSVPLPMAVVMALKEYEFRPQADPYQITLNVPFRQSKNPSRQSRERPQKPAPSTATVVTDEPPAAKQVQPMRVNSGIARGLAVQRVAPKYPEAAKKARLQGLTAFEAVITKQGDVESLKTSKGSFILIEAAYEAVKQWKYKPYLLNGGPVEVLTDIEIFFNLN